MEQLEYPTELQLQQSSLTVTEQDMIALFQRFMVLQNQFEQLTAYTEQAFTRIKALETIVHPQVLS